jgi:hypothetical protein
MCLRHFQKLHLRALVQHVLDWPFCPDSALHYASNTVSDSAFEMSSEPQLMKYPYRGSFTSSTELATSARQEQMQTVYYPAQIVMTAFFESFWGLLQ